MLSRLKKDERGIAAVVVAVVVIALMGAAMITIDAGNIWTTRRGIITGTDASVLDAAQMFNTGAFNACEATTSGSAAWNAANQHATDVLAQNHFRAEHDLTDPIQFDVDVLDASQCGIVGGYTPGKVTYEGRLEAQGFFSSIFGFGNTKPVSTSTAAWGYIQSIGEGLRPISVCEDYEQFQIYLDYWQALHDGDATNDAGARNTYNGYFGTEQGLAVDGSPGDVDPIDGVVPNSINTYGRWPFMSMGYPPGEADPPPDQKSNPNFGLPYTNPATDSRFSTVHRIVSPDPNSPCGHANGNRGWVDLRGADTSGAASADLLREWLYNGYPGEVSLSPVPDCGEGTDEEFCGSAPGDKNTLMEPLHTLTCPVATAPLDCQYIFPILVVDCVGRVDASGNCIQGPGTGGENAEYVQTAFLFVVLRGYGKVSNGSQPEGDVKGVLALDLEFVDAQTSGEVGGAPPPGAPIYQTGTQLCGADHADGHCPF